MSHHFDLLSVSTTHNHCSTAGSDFADRTIPQGKGSDPLRRSSKLDHYRRCGYSFMLSPTKTARPGAGENIGRALSQKKLSYHA